MPIIYTKHDLDVIASIKMKIRGSPPKFADPATMSKLSDMIDTYFPFQFPPRVKSDSKSAEWEEVNKVSYEPVALWMGAQARKISVEAMYVVDGGKWSGSKIAKCAQAAKAYFYRSIEAVYDKEKGFGPVVDIESIYGAVQESSTWRMFDVSIDYSDEIVNDSGGPSSGDADEQTGAEREKSTYWPLTTKITFNLAAYTQIQDEKDEKTAKQPSNLSPSPSVGWY